MSHLSHFLALGIFYKLCTLSCPYLLRTSMNDILLLNMSSSSGQAKLGVWHDYLRDVIISVLLILNLGYFYLVVKTILLAIFAAFS
jgi:hypothetical protein